MNNLDIRQALADLMEQCVTYEDAAEFLRTTAAIGKTFIEQLRESGEVVDSFSELFTNLDDPSIQYLVTIAEHKTPSVLH